MSLYRDEFRKTAVRLRLIRDELLEKGFSETPKALAEAITYLESADKVYIRELAEKKN
ncbi:MAG TPA: hypothetical protein VF531_12835 [Bacillota bacterium]